MQKVSWFNLHNHIPQRDVRKLIYRKLGYVEKCIARIAHNSKAILHDPVHFANTCASLGYIGLLDWAYSSKYRFKTKWKMRLNGSWDESTNYALFNNARKTGHEDIMDWARDHRFGCERYYGEYVFVLKSSPSNSVNRYERDSDDELEFW